MQEGSTKWVKRTKSTKDSFQAQATHFFSRRNQNPCAFKNQRGESLKFHFHRSPFTTSFLWLPCCLQLSHLHCKCIAVKKTTMLWQGLSNTELNSKQNVIFAKQSSSGKRHLRQKIILFRRTFANSMFIFRGTCWQRTWRKTWMCGVISSNCSRHLILHSAAAALKHLHSALKCWSVGPCSQRLMQRKPLSWTFCSTLMSLQILCLYGLRLSFWSYFFGQYTARFHCSVLCGPLTKMESYNII